MVLIGGAGRIKRVSCDFVDLRVGLRGLFAIFVDLRVGLRGLIAIFCGYSVVLDYSGVFKGLYGLKRK